MLQQWLLGTHKGGPWNSLLLQNPVDLTVAAARVPLPGENEPWESNTGRNTTQPRRRHGTSSAGATRRSSTRSTRTARMGPPATVRGASVPFQAPFPGQPEPPLSPWENSGHGPPTGTTCGGSCIDPRLLQRNPSGSLPETPESGALPEQSNSCSPPEPALPAQTSESPEIGDDDESAEDMVRRYLRFEDDGGKGTSGMD